MLLVNPGDQQTIDSLDDVSDTGIITVMVEDYDSSTIFMLIQFFRNGSDVGEITATTSTQYSRVQIMVEERHS